jgi:hypothetical protein
LSGYEHRVSRGAHSQPPMGSALQASQALRVTRAEAEVIGIENCLA